MNYHPDWRVVHAPGAASALMQQYPFAHLSTVHGYLCSTRTPFIADCVDGKPVKLRAHLNARNPQADGLDGQEALVVFDGASSYVSPHWRTDIARAATYDYEQVQVRGRVHVSEGIDFFRQLIDDLAALIEPQYSQAGDYPIWQTSMTPSGYIEHLFPAVRAFWIEVTSVQVISKLHQAFPDHDRRSIADHLDRVPREGSRIIAAKIREQLKG